MATNIFFGSKEWWSIGTTFLFLVVAMVAFVVGEFVYGILGVLVFFAAFLFHITKPQGPVYWSGERQNFWQLCWLYVDTFFSTLFAVYTAWLLFQRSGLIEIGIVAVAFLIAFYLYWRSSKWYEIEHTLWHVIVAILAIIILL